MNKLAKLLYKFRSYTPLPFIVLMVVFHNASTTSILLGGLIILIGESIRFWGVSFIGENTRSTKNFKVEFLVTNGPFSYVRNPLYLSNILIYIGFALMSMALFPYLLIIVALTFYLQYKLIISEEEKFLEDQFGDQYREYKNAVNRFIPTFSPYRSEKKFVILSNYQLGLQSESRTFQALFTVVILNIMIYLVK